ncbi:hypothetical protein C2E23DRAFT_800519 [Lenzites betulinus]|nr:hypothetical protein C2E23DRAFT_800519 [Lenzites betulinus]
MAGDPRSITVPHGPPDRTRITKGHWYTPGSPSMPVPKHLLQVHSGMITWTRCRLALTILTHQRLLAYMTSG